MSFCKVLAVCVLVVMCAFAVPGRGRLIKRTRQGHCDDSRESCENYYLHVACNEANYPELSKLFTQVRSREDLTRKLREGSMRTYCSEIVAAGKCVQSTVESMPSDCEPMMPPGLKQMLPYIIQVVDLVEDICDKDVSTIERNKNCFFADQRFSDAETCSMEVYMKVMENPNQDIDPCQLMSNTAICTVYKMSQDNQCSNEASELFRNRVQRLLDIAEPACQQAHSVPGPMELYLRRMKFF